MTESGVVFILDRVRIVILAGTVIVVAGTVIFLARTVIFVVVTGCVRDRSRLRSVRLSWAVNVSQPGHPLRRRNESAALKNVEIVLVILPHPNQLHVQSQRPRAPYQFNTEIKITIKGRESQILPLDPARLLSFFTRMTAGLAADRADDLERVAFY